jgi:3-oxoacyl-[acyl-carrier-protein] synthase-1
VSTVVVVKVGAQTAIGLDARQTGFMLRAGFPAMAEAPLANAAGEAITAIFVPTIDGRLAGAERLAALAAAPFAEAVEPVRDLAGSVHVAVDEGCLDAPLVTRLLETTIARAMPAARVAVEARGEAGPGRVLTAALRALDSRQVDVAVIGGVHSDHDPRAIAALEASGRLFSRDNLDARIPGEAAAFFVLMREADARRQLLPPLARVLGVGVGREEARPDNDDAAYPAFGLTAAVREATAQLAAGGQTAGWFLTDLTHEMRRQYEWQTVFVRSQNVLGRPYLIESPAQRIGYLGAAALPLFVAMAATAWEHGYAPAPVALAVAGNDGGDRAALVLGAASG